MSDPVHPRAEIVVDIAAIRHNVRVLGDLVAEDGPVQLMVVVKADGYGHGLVEAVARSTCGRSRRGSAWRPSTRRWRCARAATRAGCCAG